MPIALNSGLFWPRRTILRIPGTVVVEMLDPIPPGLDKEVFFKRLQSDIETATARLIEEGRKEIAAKCGGVSFSLNAAPTQLGPMVRGED